MDSTEDLSARILLKHILNVETPRTPLTRSVAAKSNALRRSGRLNKHGSSAFTPQAMLRQSLKRKMRESISSRTLPSRRTASTVLKQTPGPASMLFDDGDTPRQIFKNILLTEPVKSPAVNEHAESQEQQASPDSSLQTRRPSIELSGLELSDLTIGNVETTVKRLNRKRPHRSLNVTAFEKRLKRANDLATAEEEEQPLEDYSSLSLSSSTSLSLKTPFIDVRTERKALQRRGLNRRKVSEEDFGAAVDKREMGKNHGMSISAPSQVNETTYSEGFTLGLSKISEPDITTDIVNFNTALYSQTDGIMSNYSTLATQDKPTVMASQIQRDLREQLDVNEQHYLFPMEENTMTDAQDRSQSLPTHIDNAVKDAAASCQSEQEKSVANHKQNQGEDDEELKKEDPVTKQQSHQEVPLSLTVEKEGNDSQMNDEGESVFEEEVEEVENEKEEMEEENEELDNEKEGMEEGEKDEITEMEGDEAEEEGLKQTEDDIKGAEQAEDAVEVSVGDNVVVGDSQEDEGGNSEHITRRAVCAEDELIMSIQNTEADLPDNTKTEYDEVAEPSIHKDGAEVEVGPNENKENTFLESGPSEDVEQVEQSVEEEEEGDFPGQTPAFVKQKRNFSHSDAQASPFAPKNIQPSDAGPGPKSKQKVQSKARSPKSDPGLPKSYLMKVLKHFAKSKVSADVYPVLKDVMDTFFGRLAKDLGAYALHARRSTIGFADCELLLRRQGHVNDKVPVEVLIEKYLRMDQRKLLIPIATSGNVVFPTKR